MTHDPTYIAQWLKTATDGEVIHEIAFATNRSKFFCKRCQIGMAVSEENAALKGTIIDYSVQEFVAKHSISAHKVKTTQQVNAAHDFAHATASGVGAMVNAGFLANGVASNYKPYPLAPMIDLKPERAAAIKTQMDEYAKKLGDDEKQAKKIKELQTPMAPGTLIEVDPTVPPAWMNDWLSKPRKYPLPVKQKPSTAVLTVTQKDQYYPQFQEWANANGTPVQRAGSTAPPLPAAPKPRILKNVEGRKFR